MKKFLSVLFILFYNIALLAQDGSVTGTDIWKWSPPKDYHNAIVHIRNANGNEGSGTVFKVVPIKDDEEFSMCFIMTAAHIFYDYSIEDKLIPSPEKNTFCQLSYTTGMIVPDCIVIKSDLEHDLAIIIGLCPKNLKPIEISAQEALPNDPLECCAVGGNTSITKGEIRHYYCTAGWTTRPDYVVSMSYLLCGDSGGAILNSDGKLVGVTICGGVKASGEIVHQASGWKQTLVCPHVGVGLKHIQTLIKDTFTDLPVVDIKKSCD